MREFFSKQIILFVCSGAAILVLCALLLNFGMGSVEAKSVSRANLGGTNFPGTNTGSIPDNSCGSSDLVIDVPVTGTSGALTNVDVNLTFSPVHTWVGDLDMELVSPDGTRHWIQSWTGGNGDAGYQSDAAGPYTFSDNAPDTPTWWAAALATANSSPIPAGSYRTQGPGPSATEPPLTVMTAAFSGIPSVDGTWKIVIGDCASGDTGSVSAASLDITTGPNSVDNDYDGDGSTDFVVTRDLAPPVALANNSKTGRGGLKTAQTVGSEPTAGDSAVPEQAGSTLAWWIMNSGSGSATTVDFGQSRFADFVTPADFDGDGRTDIAIWRRITTGQPSGNAFFYILNSFDSTVQEVDFGQFGDNPSVVGDYDGDGRADPAVFRQDFSTPGQSYFFYKGSAGGGETTYVPWGDNTGANLKSYPGDFDGDGMYDFVVYRDVGGQGQFVLLRSSDFGVEYINWGLPDDLLAPGDYDGDGQTDFMVVRLGDPGLEFQWYLLERDGGGTGASPINWGTAALINSNEYIAQGDYDGDGSTDIAIWRQDSSNSDNCYYYVRRSSDMALQAVEWGASGGDAPVNGWTVQ